WRLIEIAQIRRLLAFSDRHQEAICAQEIVVPANDDVLIIEATGVLLPYAIAVAPVAPGDRPRTGQRVVEGRDLVVQDIGIGLVEADALLDDSRFILMERRPA